MITALSCVKGRGAALGSRLHTTLITPDVTADDRQVCVSEISDNLARLAIVAKLRWTLCLEEARELLLGRNSPNENGSEPLSVMI